MFPILLSCMGVIGLQNEPLMRSQQPVRSDLTRLGSASKLRGNGASRGGKTR